MRMEQKVLQYIRHHTMTVVWVVVLGFVLLAAGEYYLYRKVMFVNKQVSEGVMQIKESINPPTPTPTPIRVPMMRKEQK